MRGRRGQTTSNTHKETKLRLLFALQQTLRISNIRSNTQLVLRRWRQSEAALMHRVSQMLQSDLEDTTKNQRFRKAESSSVTRAVKSTRETHRTFQQPTWSEQQANVKIGIKNEHK